MADILKAMEAHVAETGDVKTVCDYLYQQHFQEYLGDVQELYRRIKADRRVITDAELEQILTELPLNLFMVSEGLNSIRLEAEVLKLRNKEKRIEFSRSYAEQFESVKMSATDRKDAISTSVNFDMIGSESLLAVYSSVITRVENEISFARELIMSAKKIWDSRRSTERVNPVSEQLPSDDSQPNLPVYRKDTGGSAYIK